jgi:hypothetical protein
MERGSLPASPLGQGRGLYAEVRGHSESLAAGPKTIFFEAALKLIAIICSGSEAIKIAFGSLNPSNQFCLG